MGRKTSGKKKFPSRRGIVITGRLSKQMQDDLRGIEKRLREVQAGDCGKQ